MGELIAIAFAIAFVGVLFAIGSRNTNRQIKATLSKRDNLSHEEFLRSMSPDVSRAAAEFLWASAMNYLEALQQEITPHPDDHLVDDLPIDDEEWSMDWPREWAEKQGFHESNLPDWPKDWPVTVRNFGRWLDRGPQ